MRNKKKMENWGIFSNVKNIDTLWLNFLYFGNSLRGIKEDLGELFSNQEIFADGFNVCSIRDPYYEPLLWFIIACGLPYIRSMQYNWIVA